MPHWYARTKIAVPYDANPNDCMGCADEDCPCPGEIWAKVTDMITNEDPEVLKWFLHEVRYNHDFVQIVVLVLSDVHYRSK